MVYTDSRGSRRSACLMDAVVGSKIRFDDLGRADHGSRRMGRGDSFGPVGGTMTFNLKIQHPGLCIL